MIGLHKKRPKSGLSYVMNKYCGICQYCGYSIWDFDEVRGMTVDHLTPVCAGGSNKKTNRVLACAICNKYASTHAFDSFEKKRDFVRNKLLAHNIRLYN